MAERSFKGEVEKLRAGEGEVFHGEGILAVTKALLQCGVSYVGGYQGSPISHLMDVFADADPLLKELGVYFENSASEAGAAAMLSASVMYPVRGAVTWKSTVGTNVASDALSNLASSGVVGGTVVIIGEDYGEGSSIMQERTHAFAMKSQMWLLDPRPSLENIVKFTELAFELSEASNTPVFLELRVRSCHMYGRFIAKDNQRPKYTLAEALNNPIRDVDRIVLPPASFKHEQEKLEQRLPNAIEFIKARQMNEFLGGNDNQTLGIIIQGALFNSLNRALIRFGLSDHLGNVKIPIYVMNVTYPIIEDEVLAFCQDKKAVLMIEEGQPNFIEQAVGLQLYQHRLNATLHGKDMLPAGGDYSIGVLTEGLKSFFDKYDPTQVYQAVDGTQPVTPKDAQQLLSAIPVRPAGFCTGCPERPIFAALKLIQKNLGDYHISEDIGCHLFSILPPFNLGATTMGYGLGSASASAFNMAHQNQTDQKKVIAIMGDGGFWHNGLNSGIANAVFNKSDGLTIIVDNNYAAATGGQDLLSSRFNNNLRSINHPIEKAVRGVGVQHVDFIDRTYDVDRMVKTITRALTSTTPGPKVIIAQSECMLNRQRRDRREKNQQLKQKQRVVNERFGVDSNICSGDHACMRLSGCPSLTLTYSENPLREDPIAHIDQSCVACGNCGEVAETAILCPSFYKAQVVKNPTSYERVKHRIKQKLFAFLQVRRIRKRQLA